MARKLDLVSYPVGVLVEINDAFTGHRKLVRVGPNETSYMDLTDSDATPFPLYAALKPEPAGDVYTWAQRLIESAPERYAPFVALVHSVMTLAEDALTALRAVHWAYTHDNFDVAAALAAGMEQTVAIRRGRSMMDTLLVGAVKGV